MSKLTTTNFSKNISTRFKGALAALGCFGILFGAVAMMPLSADAQGSRYGLTVHNRSAYTIYRLYVSRSDENNWGPDQLGRRVIAPGASFTLNNILPGEYDLKVVDQDGDTVVRRGINVFNDKTWTLY
jgi:hypothetical protein